MRGSFSAAESALQEISTENMSSEAMESALDEFLEKFRVAETRQVR